MDERILRRIEQLVEAAESRFPSTLGEEWTKVGRPEAPPPARREAERIDPERAEERYTPRSRVERIEPERAVEQYTPRSRLERAEPDREGRPMPRPVSSSPVSKRRASKAPPIRHLLRSRESLRQAILFQEILGPPKALRQDDDPFRR